MRHSLLLPCLLALGFSSAAYATPISAGVYTLTGVTAPQGFTAGATSALTGSVTINASGFVTAASITFADSAVGSPTFSTVSSSGMSASNDFTFVANGSVGQVVLYYLPTLNVSGGITLCVVGGSCPTYQDSYIQIYGSSYNNYQPANLTAGSLTPKAVSSAPEPSSLVLLGSGMLAAAGAARRRLLKA